MTNYIKYNYMLEPLAEKEAFNQIIIDESLFNLIGGKQQWVVGLLNYKTNNLRLEIVNNRNTDILKIIITTHVLKGNYIITDCLSGYNFLSLIN